MKITMYMWTLETENNKNGLNYVQKEKKAAAKRNLKSTLSAYANMYARC